MYLLTFQSIAAYLFIVFDVADPDPKFCPIMLQYDLFICPGAKPKKTKPKDSPQSLRWIPSLTCWKKSIFITLPDVERSEIFKSIDTLFCRTTRDDEYLSKFHKTVQKSHSESLDYHKEMFKFFVTLSRTRKDVHVDLFNAYTKLHKGKYSRNGNRQRISCPEKHYATWVHGVFDKKVSKTRCCCSYQSFLVSLEIF